MTAMRDHEINTVDGIVRFRGRRLVREVGNVRIRQRQRARVTVTVYVTESGDGIIQEDIQVEGQVGTFAHTVHAGTSPDWRNPDQFADSTKVLNRAWERACRAEETLRPVRKWRITEDFDELRIPTGPDTYVQIRSRLLS